MSLKHAELYLLVVLIINKNISPWLFVGFIALRKAVSLDALCGLLGCGWFCVFAINRSSRWAVKIYIT